MNDFRPDMSGMPLSRRIEDAADELLIPSHGTVISALLEALDSPSPDLDRIARIMRTDPSLCARFLLISAERSFLNGSPLDIPALIRQTPLRTLRVIATSLAIQEFHSRHHDEKHHDLSGFLSHSLAVAHLCRLIAQETGGEDPMEAYCAGLLHDIGELAILAGAGAGYGLLLGICSDEQELLSLEPQYTGTTHAEAGASLLSRLGPVSFIPDAILFHHLPSDVIGSADTLSRILWTAHALLTPAGESPPPDGEGTLLTGISSATLASLRDAIPRLVADDLAFLGIPFPTRQSPLPLVNHIPTERDSIAAESSPPSPLESSLAAKALMAPLQQSLFEWQTEAGLLSALSIATRLIFGTRRTFLLTHDLPRNLLVPIPEDGAAPRLGRLLLSPDVPSAPARALITGTPVSTFEVSSPSTVDRQISRLLGTEGFIALPIDAGEESRGVLILSLSQRQQTRAAKMAPLLKGFASVTASAHAAIVRMRRREEEIGTLLREEFIRHSRRVAHEVSNPLGIINQYLAILGETVADRVPVSRELTILKEEIDRVGKIVGTLGELPPSGEVGTALSLNGVVEGMLALYGESLFAGRGIIVRKELSPDIPGIRGEKDRLKQILLNLWKNASEAMAQGGEISIATRALRGGSGSHVVELTIADTGPGIPPDVVERLFSPLDPSRKQGNGGVGLSIVASLVAELNGTIYCHTAPGYGTRFTIIFPAD